MSIAAPASRCVPPVFTVCQPTAGISSSSMTPAASSAMPASGSVPGWRYISAEKYSLYDKVRPIVGFFGSFVRGDQPPLSDIDILVEFTPEKHTFDNFMEVAYLLEEILGRKVELITPEALSPHIGPHILREVERVPIAA